MKNIIKNNMIFIIICILSMNTAIADTVINHKDLTQEELEKIYLENDWECEWKDPYANGTKTATFDTVTQKEAHGKGKNSYCPSGWDKTEIRFKGKNLKVKAFDRPEPCLDVIAKFKLYKTDDDSFYLKGSYSYNYQGTSISGNETCKAVPK